jgi:hypothetical protein
MVIKKYAKSQVFMMCISAFVGVIISKNIALKLQFTYIIFHIKIAGEITPAMATKFYDQTI